MSDFANPVVPAKPALEDSGDEPSMDYLGAWTYLFDAPSWLQDLLLASLCTLIPIIGKMMVDGYLWERAGVANGQLPGPHSPFDFSHLGRYLQRGIWPFVMATMVQVLFYGVVAVLFLVYLIGLRGADLSWLAKYSESELTILVWSVGMPVLLLLFALIKLVILVAMAMIFHSERTCDFRNAFDFDFICGFIYHIWWEGVLVISYVGLIAPFILLAGALCCLVGVFPALIIVAGATEHFYWRLYRLYVARGGKPIAIKQVT